MAVKEQCSTWQLTGAKWLLGNQSGIHRSPKIGFGDGAIWRPHARGVNIPGGRAEAEETEMTRRMGEKNKAESGMGPRTTVGEKNNKQKY